MTQTPPRLVDSGLLARRLARAARQNDGDEDGGPGFLRARVAEDMADRLAATLRPFPVALDLASWAGETAALLKHRGGLAFRAATAPAPGVSVVVTPDALPLGAESVDLVASALTLQLADDLPGLLAQIRRALRPDGLFLAALLGGETLGELRQAFAQAEAEVEGGASPRVLPFADVRSYGGLLQRAGFTLPVADVDRVTVRYASPFGLFADLRAWGATNPLIERRRTPLKRATLARAVALYAQDHADPDGRVRATFEIVWLSGWAPHPDQQTPLRPGSAKTRLADALGTAERRLL